KSTRIGQFLAPFVGRYVAIQVKGRTGRATLRVEEGRSREKKYFFEIVWDSAAGDAPATGPESVPRPRPPDAPAPRTRRGRRGTGPRPRTVEPSGTAPEVRDGPTTGNDESW